MSERTFILDPKGHRIPLLDGHGNLTAEAMALYVGDDLSAEDRTAVDAVAALDEMTRDALDGLKATAVNHRAAFTSLNAEIAERTGTETVVHTLQREIPWMRIAAGLALMICAGGITYLVSQWVGKEQMASNDTLEAPLAVEEMNEVPMEEAEDTPAEEPMEPVTTAVADVPPPPEPAAPVARPEEKPLADLKKKEAAPEPKAEQKKAPAPETKPKASQPIAAAGTTKDASSNGDAPAAAARKADEQPSVATAAGAETAKKAEPTKPMPSTLDGTTAARQAAKRELQSLAQTDAENEVKSQSEKPLPFDRAENPPKFPGGDAEMIKFITKNKNFPPALSADEVSGAVYVNFVIEKDGRVSNAKVVQGAHPFLDEDATRVIRAMPKWTPGEIGGEKVRTTRTVIVKYE